MRKFLFLLVGMLSIRPAAAQTANRYEEVLPMREDMVVDVKVGNWAEEGVFPFAIDFGREHTVIAAGRDTLLFGLEDTLRSVALGENIFFKTMAVTTENLKSTPPPRLDGVLGLDFFARSVVTIDRKGGMITISAPYKPAYMPLKSRLELMETLPMLDSLLEEGVVTLDFVHSKSYFISHAEKPDVVITRVEEQKAEQGPVAHLNTAMFRNAIFDIRSGDPWKYAGKEPCVIDFWAPWCGPCLKLNPAFEALAKEYEGRVKFYKVNVDNEPEIASYFKITAIPLLVFIPADGPPRPVLLSTPEEIRANVEKLL